MTSIHQANPGIFCDNCGEACRPNFIAGQCQTCGGYICKSCVLHHLCMKRTREEVRKMLPEYVDYSAELLTPPHNY
jgi:hypothetical protein